MVLFVLHALSRRTFCYSPPKKSKCAAFGWKLLEIRLPRRGGTRKYKCANFLQAIAILHNSEIDAIKVLILVYAIQIKKIPFRVNMTIFH
jgi:hypothetical protein